MATHTSPEVRHARRSKFDPVYNAQEDHGCCYVFWVLTVWPKIKSCLRSIRNCLCRCIDLDRRNTDRVDIPPYMSGSAPEQPHRRYSHKPESYFPYPTGNNDELLRQRRIQYYSSHVPKLSQTDQHLISEIKPYAIEHDDNLLLLAIAILETSDGADNDQYITELQTNIIDNPVSDQRANGLFAALFSPNFQDQCQAAKTLLKQERDAKLNNQRIVPNTGGDSVDNDTTPPPLLASHPVLPSAPSIETHPEPFTSAYATGFHTEGAFNDEEIQQCLVDMAEFSCDPYINLAVSILIGETITIQQLNDIRGIGTDYTKAIEYSQGDAETLLVAATHSPDKATQHRAAFAFLKDCQELHEATQASKMDQPGAEADAPETHIVDLHRPQGESSSTSEYEHSESPQSEQEAVAGVNEPISLPGTFDAERTRRELTGKTRNFLQKFTINDPDVIDRIAQIYYDIHIQIGTNCPREGIFANAAKFRQELDKITGNSQPESVDAFVIGLTRTTRLDFNFKEDDRLHMSLVENVDEILKGEPEETSEDKTTTDTPEKIEERGAAATTEATPSTSTAEAPTKPTKPNLKDNPELFDIAINMLAYNIPRDKLMKLNEIGILNEDMIVEVATREGGDLSLHTAYLNEQINDLEF